MALNFVHVGKCAGTSIEIALKQLRMKYSGFHCFDANVKLKKLVAAGGNQYFLISVRDPIKRFVSAFYWDLYEKRMKDDNPGPGGLWKTIYDTFQSPNELAEAVSSSDQGRSEFAKQVFTDSYLHMHLSLGWYFSVEDANRLDSTNAFVVRTEHADADFTTFLRQVCNKKVRVQLAREKSDYKHEIEGYCVDLSDRAVENLVEMYRDDYLILEMFRERGMNSYEFESLQDRRVPAEDCKSTPGG